MGFFDDELLIQAYGGWLYGISAMAFLHNFFVSVFLYKVRQTNTSNILKIIFNLSGLLRSIGQLWFLLIPVIVSIEECRAVSFMTSLANVILKSSLAGFLLWRLRQIENKKSDFWIGIALFFARFGFHLGQLSGISPIIKSDPIDQTTFCISGSDNAQIPGLITIFFDLLIEVFVTVRLVQILNRANKNASQISSNITRKTKRSLFTAVMYWNFVRLVLAMCFNSVLLYYSVIGLNKNDSLRLGVASNTLQVIFLVLLSYSVTADAEIVRVIEGKKNNNGSSSNSAGTGKNMPQTPKSTSTPSHYQASSEPPKYSAGNYSYSKNEAESGDIGENKIAIVSMKRLSFFEWANAVVGNKIERKNNDIVDEEKGIEIDEDNGIEIDEDNSIEIVQEIADEVAENSYSNNQNRDSSFSGTTTITTTTSSTIDDDDIV